VCVLTVYCSVCVAMYAAVCCSVRCSVCCYVTVGLWIVCVDFILQCVLQCVL